MRKFIVFCLFILTGSALLILTACAPVMTQATREVPPLPPTLDPNPLPAYVVPAQADLMRKLDLPSTEVVASTVETVDWPNSCLGLMKPEDVCLEVITPGYRIIFHTPKGDYAYHTDRSGQKFRAAGLLPAGTPSPIATPAIIRPGDSGIEGLVTISPTCGGPVRPGQDCTAPYQASITVLDQADRVVSQVSSDAEGRFRLALPPGNYTLRPEKPAKGIARAADVSVTVVAGQVTTVEITYDSGLR
ncbi:MAG: carboxypeptidase-like regulatory domain-containing protein [Anaerolineae bacterium]